MSSTRAVSPHTLPVPGRCRWEWHWEDVDLRCTDRIVPGERFCAEHLIEAADSTVTP